MAHGVPVPDDCVPWQRLRAVNPVYWPRLTQALACLGVLHHKPEEPWRDSARRAVLVDLVNGVEDWAADAAANALVVAAWTDPGCRADVGEVVGARFAAAAQALTRRPVSIAGSLAHLVVITPQMPPGPVRLARTLIEHEAKAAAAPPGQPPPGQRPSAQPPAPARQPAPPPRRRLFRRPS